MNALEIKNLSKYYDGFSLENVNLSLPSGCIMGLIGENGAGKSTIIKLILNMIKKDSGEILIFGSDSINSDVKENIGVVLDEVGLPDCLTPKQINNIMANSFKQWNSNVYLSYIKNLSLPCDKQFKDFSKGMKMKLGISIALSHNAKLLILDEATSGLDPVVRDEILDVFNDFTRDENNSILISSHIVSDLEKLCDYIAFLHKGKLLLCDEKDRLLERYGVIYCSNEQLSALSSAAIKGKKTSPYGIEAVVERSKMPPGFNINPIDIEDLFIFMAKEAK